MGRATGSRRASRWYAGCSSRPYYISYATALVRRSIVSPTECFAAEDRTADDVGLSLRLVCGAARSAYLARPLVGITFHQEALNTVAGGQVRVDDGYMATFASVANEWRVKRRFLDRFGAELADPADLRRVLDRRMQAEMLTDREAQDGPDASAGGGGPTPGGSGARGAAPRAGAGEREVLGGLGGRRRASGRRQSTGSARRSAESDHVASHCDDWT